jgi:hypothetical protein
MGESHKKYPDQHQGKVRILMQEGPCSSVRMLMDAFSFASFVVSKDRGIATKTSEVPKFRLSDG